MTPHPLGFFIDVESSENTQETHTVPIAPQRAVPRTYHTVPDPIELQSFQFNGKQNAPPASGRATPSGTQTPRTPSEVEMSRPATPRQNEDDGVEAMQSFSSPPMNRFRMLSVCLLNFGNGLSDSAPGALIPYSKDN
jgi:hypothetical protein